MRQFLRRLAHWFRFDRHDASLAEELECHRALIQADLETRGMAPADAAAESRRAMGNIGLAREDAREVWVGVWVDQLWRDLRYGFRGLRREPTFALTAVLTFALGVATTTTVFSVVDAELWKPLPFPQPGELVVVSTRGPAPRTRLAISGAELVDWQESATALSSLAAVGDRRRRILQGPVAESVVVADVTSNYLSTLGRPPIAGRTFTDSAEAGLPAVVLTDRAWQRLFDADAAVVGRTLTLDSQPVTVIGVVRANDSLGPDPDIFMAIDQPGDPLRSRTEPVFYSAIGRLNGGARANGARDQLQGIIARMAQTAPDRWQGYTVFIEDLRGFYTGSNWRPLYFCLGAALVVLLLSAVNVASLLLGRAIRRIREFALRGALGGGQAAIARQLLVEGALVAVPAGALGLLSSVWALSLISTQIPAGVLLRGSDIPVDMRVAGFAFGVTLATTVLCVLMPMLVARRTDLAPALGPGGRTGRAAGEGRARAALLTVQMALTLILLSGAGIFFKSFVALTNVPLGFDPAGRLAVRTSLSGPVYKADAQVRDYAEALLQRAQVIPGIRHAAIGSSSPLGSGPVVYFAEAGQPPPPAGQAPRAIMRAVTPGYFQALGISLVKGQAFSDADVTGATSVAVVNEHFADIVFDGQSPVGRTIELLPSPRPHWTQQAENTLLIVGMVANVKEIGINEVGFSDIYVPFAQMPAPSFDVIVSADGEMSGLGDQLRWAAADVDPTMPVLQIVTFDERVAGALETDRLNLLLISVFAAVAVVLAGIGVYGAMAYAVQARTREFGVRLALGALPSKLSAGALLQAGRLAVIGGAAGLGATLLLARVIGDAWYLVPGDHNGLLYGVALTDPQVLALAFSGLVAVAMAAGLVPARRVARVDPVRALRAD